MNDVYTTLLRRLGCIDLVYTVLRLADHQDMLRSLALAALANGAAAQTTTAGLTIAVDANAAEASACADPPSKKVKLAKWEIPGYLETGEGKKPTCRRGTHGLDECLAEAGNAQETADCYEDYGVKPPA